MKPGTSASIMPYKILVVDDEPLLSNMLKDLLQCEGYDVLTAFNGEKALEILKNNPVNLIILDVMMPGMNGFEVCKRLKTQRKYNLTPIVMLTALKDDFNKLEGFRTGADAYLTKPFDYDDLCNLIKHHLSEADKLQAKGLLERINFTIGSHYTYLKELNEFITQLFIQTELREEEINDLKIAFLELGMNSIEHGNKLKVEKKVHISYSLYKDRLVISFRDEGEGFNIKKIPDPTEEDNIFSLRGRGIHLVKSLMNKLEYVGSGNEVLMTKYLTYSKEKMLVNSHG